MQKYWSNYQPFIIKINIILDYKLFKVTIYVDRTNIIILRNSNYSLFKGNVTQVVLTIQYYKIDIIDIYCLIYELNETI